MNLFFKMMRLFVVSAAVFLGLHLSTSLAAEIIKSFDSSVKVAKNGKLTVTETITVISESRQIRRGIYRDFPLLFEDVDGKQKKVGFELVSTTRDGRPDKNRLVRNSDSIRIYIGDKDVFIPRGEHTYVIVYETDRQIRYFPDHDELFWNVTGNFWNFPIEKATASFVLPDGAVVEDTVGYTGRIGSTEQDLRLTAGPSGRTVKAAATRALRSGEGMSVAIQMTKGSIAAPSESQKSAWFWQDNKAMIVAFVGLAVVGFYYFISWFRIGRDLPAGVIVPRWDAPDGMSPALVNYIYKKGLSGKGFDAISAALLNLAVKGLVVLDKESKNLRITASENPKFGTLPVGEAAILKQVYGANNQSLTVSSSNGSKVKALQQKFASAMEKEHRSKFYKHNIGATILGVLFSVAALIAMFIFGDFSDEMIGFLIAGGMITLFVSIFLFSFARQFLNAKHLLGKIFNLIIAGFLTFGILSTLFSLVVSGFIASLTEPWPLVAIVGIIVLNVLFFFLLGAPTTLGREKMDEVEGLKTYLTLAEKDRMNMVDAPDFSTQHYEELLPYAVALGVEKPWSKSFESWLAAAIAAGAVAASYQPSWYRGNDFSGDSLSNTMDDFTSSMQSGFSSAMPVPKSSSSGFSGGSSGGGGGGGGGGGW